MPFWHFFVPLKWKTPFLEISRCLRYQLNLIWYKLNRGRWIRISHLEFTKFVAGPENVEFSTKFRLAPFSRRRCYRAGSKNITIRFLAFFYPRTGKIKEIKVYYYPLWIFDWNYSTFLPWSPLTEKILEKNQKNFFPFFSRK